MTDEMTIKQRPSAMPYLLGGAALGTAGGFVANATVPYLKGKAMTHEDIIKEVKDTTSFSNRTAEGAEHAASWKEVGEKHAAWQTAEAEVKTAELGVPKDAKLVAEMEQATKDKNKYIEDFIANERKAANKSVTGGIHVATPNEIQSLGSSLKAEEATEVNRLLEEYRQAVETAKTDKTAKVAKGSKKAPVGQKNAATLADDLTKFQQKIRLSYQKIDSAARADKSMLRFIGYDSRKKAVNEVVEALRGEIEALYPTVSASDTQRIQHELQKTGSKKTGKKAVNDILRKINEPILEQRKALLDEILGEKKLVEVVDKATGKKQTISTYANVENFMRVEEAYHNGIARFDADSAVKKAGGRSKIQSVSYYQDKINKLKGKKNPDIKAIKNFENLQRLAERLEKIESSHTNGMNRILNSTSYAKQQATKINNAVQLQVGKQIGALQRFANQEGRSALKELLFPATEAVEINVEEVTTRAKEAFAKTEAGKTFADLEQRYAAATERTVNKEILAAAKEKAATAKSELEKLAKELGEKYCKGKAKWIAPVVGAAVLGLCALGLRPKAEA